MLFFLSLTASPKCDKQHHQSASELNDIRKSVEKKQAGNSYFCGVVLSERMRYAINLFLENAKKNLEAKHCFIRGIFFSVQHYLPASSFEQHIECMVMRNFSSNFCDFYSALRVPCLTRISCNSKIRS